MPDLHFPYSGGTEVLARNPDRCIWLFFLLLETSEKLTKIDFSSVAEKKEHYTRKVFILDDFRGYTF
jgi:hypothetical protein